MTFAELYPEQAAELNEEGYFYGPGDYQPIVNAIGTVALQVDDSDYQGDTRVLYVEPDGRVGLLIFGWGSCSGCDALQACDSPAEVEELAEKTAESTRWFVDKADALDYITTKDWELEYAWHSGETRRFIEQAKELLAQ